MHPIFEMLKFAGKYATCGFSQNILQSRDRYKPVSMSLRSSCHNMTSKIRPSMKIRPTTRMWYWQTDTSALPNDLKDKPDIWRQVSLSNWLGLQKASQHYTWHHSDISISLHGLQKDYRHQRLNHEKELQHQICEITTRAPLYTSSWLSIHCTLDWAGFNVSTNTV